MAIIFSVKECDNFSIVSGLIPGDGVLDPSELPSIEGPDVPAHKGVILDGRMPIWAYARLLHQYHPTAWIAVHAPRDEGAIVVQRHVPSAPEIGAIVPLPKE